MAGAVLFAFLLGISVGVLIGRRSSAPRDAAPGPRLVGTAPADATAAAPTRRGRKAGLTAASFTPSDDILDKLRRAAEGELDPSEIDAPPPPTPTAAEIEAAAAAARAELAERERRVLERLRRLEAQDGEIDFSKQRDQGEDR